DFPNACIIYSCRWTAKQGIGGQISGKGAGLWGCCPASPRNVENLSFSRPLVSCPYRWAYRNQRWLNAPATRIALPVRWHLPAIHIHLASQPTPIRRLRRQVRPASTSIPSTLPSMSRLTRVSLSTSPSSPLAALTPSTSLTARALGNSALPPL